jgi:hypothetical protein
LVSRRDDPSHKQKVIYSLTEASIALVPLLVHMGGWGLRHTPASKELSVRAKILEDGGPKLWSEFMEELRHLHLEAPAPRRSVFARLQSAYEAAIASRDGKVPNGVALTSEEHPRLHSGFGGPSSFGP